MAIKGRAETDKDTEARYLAVAGCFVLRRENGFIVRLDSVISAAAVCKPQLH